MEAESKKLYMEGIIITGVGVFFIILALLVPNNPVVLGGWLNILAQAKMVPLITGTLTTIFGLKYTIDMYRGKTKSKVEGIENKKYAAIILGINVAYLISIMSFGFKIPTAIYLIIILIFLNGKKRKPLFLGGIIILFYVITMIVTPMALSLRLP